MGRIRGHFVSVTLLVMWALAVAMTPSCGGGGGGDGVGRGLVMLSFSLDGVDNVVLNSRPQFNFSEAVDPSTVSLASIQVREGPSFGSTVKGSLVVNGSTVFFEPQLATLCDQSDSGFKPDTTYRLQIIGFPEQFAVRNLSGQSLDHTSTFEFHTRLETDPDKYADQIPAVGPSILSATPLNGAEAVPVVAGNRIEIVMSENIDPCSIDETSVRFHMYEIGDPNMFAPIAGRTETSGFFNAGANSTADQVPADSTTWGADNTTSLAAAPQKILANIDLQQSFAETKLVITPMFGFNPDPAKNASVFPENALLVVELTFGITDYAGLPLTPSMFSFTTENRAPQQNHYALLNNDETPYLIAATTADVNTARSPSKVQGFMLFTGDGDNGVDHLSPGLPQSDLACTIDYQPNDGTPDNFHPGSDVLLDTGSTPNLCPNSTDGSFAVVFEFKSFTIPAGVTVRVVGVNPAIITVQSDVTIQTGGSLLLRGDGQAGAPQGRGGGGQNATTNNKTTGGTGVAGGGGGGDSHANNATARRVGLDGVQGYFHTTPTGSLDSSVGTTGGPGCGKGNTSAHWTAQTNSNNRNSPSGGGGGHAADGDPGITTGSGSAPTSIDLPAEGEAGLSYGDSGSRLLTPEAGSGGGAGGEVRAFSGTAGRGPGGAGGAGGGFVDLTCGGDMNILGTIDAAGSRGGSNPGGNFSPNYSWQPGTGGGGGGSGGGIRLLTPNNIVLGAATILTAAGGSGGVGGASQGTDPGLNNGGNGAVGRIALEDSNSIISGLSGAAVTPAEGSVGFYRGVFDATRFQGGGLSPGAMTEVIAVGPFNPTFLDPVQNYGGQEDFIAGIPVAGAPGIGSTAILIEVRGYQMTADGTIDAASETDWFSIGSFKDNGIENLPPWSAGHPGDIPVMDDNALHAASPHGNTGSGFTALNGTGAGGFEFIQVRMSFFLPPTIGVSDPGSFLDDWLIQFSHDQ